MVGRAIDLPPLVVICGPTASGKTSLAIELAQELGGEIICADSRTIYKGMDIGTAKPSRQVRATVPHWGLDLATPGEVFSVADFKKYADEKILDIRTRGKVPLLVGGTGLYIDSVIFDYEFVSKSDPRVRSDLERLSVIELQEYCEKNNIEMPENTLNKRYIIRAIERGNANETRRSRPLPGTIIVGIATDKRELNMSLQVRTEQMFIDGVVNEATLLGEKFGWDSEAMTGNIYPLIHDYLLGRLTFDELKSKFTTADRRLAKRQLTWLRRNPYIVWHMRHHAGAYVRASLVSE